MTSLGIVILAYADGARVAALVDELRGDHLADELIVVWNSPIAPRLHAITDANPELTVLAHPGNLGYAAGMNIGIAHFAGRLDQPDGLVFCTHDVEPGVGCLDQLRASLSQADIVGPVLTDTGARRVHSAGGVYSVVRGARHRREVPKDLQSADWVDGAMMAVSTPTLLAVGLFDWRFFMYFEDVDYCLRARRLGFRVAVDGAAMAGQHAGHQTRRSSSTWLISRNGLATARRNGGPIAAAVAMVRLLVWSMLAHDGLGSVRRSALAAYRGKQWGRPNDSLLAMDAAT